MEIDAHCFSSGKFRVFLGLRSSLLRSSQSNCRVPPWTSCICVCGRLCCGPLAYTPIYCASSFLATASIASIPVPVPVPVWFKGFFVLFCSLLRSAFRLGLGLGLGSIGAADATVPGPSPILVVVSGVIHSRRGPCWNSFDQSKCMAA